MQQEEKDIRGDSRHDDLALLGLGGPAGLLQPHQVHLVQQQPEEHHEALGIGRNQCAGEDIEKMWKFQGEREVSRKH